MRITIKALLKRKFNDRVRKQAEAAKIQQVKITKEASIISVISVESEAQISPVEVNKDSLTVDTQNFTAPLVSSNLDKPFLHANLISPPMS